MQKAYIWDRFKLFILKQNGPQHGVQRGSKSYFNTSGLVESFSQKGKSVKKYINFKISLTRPPQW